MSNISTLVQQIVEYLVENGVDEGEVDHLMRQKIWMHRTRSIMDFIIADEPHNAWSAAEAWVLGDTI